MSAWLVPRPALFERLGGAERVVHVSAAAASGKTFLLRSWITAEGLGDRTAWVSVGRGQQDAGVLAVGAGFAAGDVGRV